MARTLSPYEIAWRKGAGHTVPTDGVLHDEDELEQLTAPPAAPPAPPVAPFDPSPAAPPAPAKPAGKK